MRKYSFYNNKKSRREKLGFFTAFSLCLIAVGLALWSTYASIGGFENSNVTEPTYIATSTQEETRSVDNPVTGITVEETEYTEPETEAETTETAEATQEQTDATELYTGDNEALQTVLQVSLSLDYPVSSNKVVKEYSEDVVYNETMDDYRAHAGVDFEADIGENILAMADGVVEDIYTDGMLGNIIKVTSGNFDVYYCGVSDTVYCTEGAEVSRGDVIAQVGEIPCEAADGMHLHIEVRVGDKPIDPLTVISSDE